MSCCFRCRCPSLLQTFFFLVCFFLSPAPILSAFVSVASVVFLVVCCFCHTLDWCLFPDLALTLPLGCLALCVGAGEEGSPLLRCVITPSPNTLFWFPLLVLVLPVQLLGANGTFSLSFLSFFFGISERTNSRDESGGEGFLCLGRTTTCFRQGSLESVKNHPRARRGQQEKRDCANFCVFVCACVIECVCACACVCVHALSLSGSSVQVCAVTYL